MELSWIGLLVPLTVLLVVYIQKIINNWIIKVKSEKATISDFRGKKLSEMIKGIKMVKFDAIENIVYKRLEKIRAKEKSMIFKIFSLEGLTLCFSQFLPMANCLICFWIFETFSEKSLTSAQVYSLLATFGCIAEPIRHAIYTIGLIINGKIAGKRIGKLNRLEKMKKMEDSENLGKGEILIENGIFCYGDESIDNIFKEENKQLRVETSEKIVLKNINLRIKSGEFVAVIGKVASGKSSLGLALMNEMVRKQGRIEKKGQFAFIPQEAFLLNDTLKGNILFGSEFNRKRYLESVKFSELERDIEILPGGDLTQIGERGINLSGGQKQRVAIARAYYSNSDIFIIDDALSALDTHVGKKVMENLFLKKMKEKTRILITHKLDVLSKVDRVLIMKDGEIIQDGSYEKIRKSEEFKELKEEEEFNNEQEESDEFGEELKLTKNISNISVEKIFRDTEEKLQKEKSFRPLNENKIHKINKEEKKNKGLIKKTIVKFYIENAGNINSTLVLFSFMISVSAKIFTDLFIGKWMKNSSTGTNHNSYPLIYLSLIIGVFILYFIRTTYYSHVVTKATLNLFKKLIKNILRRPLSFFDTTPSGQIMNRCIQDIEDTDYMLPKCMENFLITSAEFLGIFVFLALVSPVHITLGAVYFGVGYKILVKNMKTNIEILRMNKIAKSPLISLASEMINGVVSIRQYGKEKFMWKKFKERLDLYTVLLGHQLFGTCWMSVRIRHLSFFAVTAVISSLTANKYFK